MLGDLNLVMNIEHRTSNVEWKKMKKQTYDPKKDEHRTSNVQHRMLNEKR